jgi:hypothetical protein
MTLKGKSTVVKEAKFDDFSDVVNKACEGLMDRQIKYSIRRIQQMEENLSGLERELDNFLLQKDRDLS